MFDGNESIIQVILIYLFALIQRHSLEKYKNKMDETDAAHHVFTIVLDQIVELANVQWNNMKYQDTWIGCKSLVKSNEWAEWKTATNVPDQKS